MNSLLRMYVTRSDVEQRATWPIEHVLTLADALVRGLRRRQAAGTSLSGRDAGSHDTESVSRGA
jgi:hypothetical protein